MTLTTAVPGAVTTPSEVSPSWRPWSRVAVVALLVATAALYLWDLPGSGWANSFYSAAAQAGSQSWKAFLFGSSDAANSIAIDKPPLSVWPAALCVRAFGLNSWSLLVPQAVMGVAAVALVWDAVRADSVIRQVWSPVRCWRAHRWRRRSFGSTIPMRC